MLNFQEFSQLINEKEIALSNRIDSDIDQGDFIRTIQAVQAVINKFQKGNVSPAEAILSIRRLVS